MKKLAITLSAALMCSMLNASAETMQRIVPVGCPLKQPCPVAQPCEQPAPVCEDECAAKKQMFMDKRCALYKKLCLTQNQVTQAKCIDEKFFDEICPLKECYKKEKCKLKDMECKKACEADIRAQKLRVRDLKKQIKAKKNAHKEAFMCLLNECQKKEFKKIKDEKCKTEKKIDCDCGCN